MAGDASAAGPHHARIAAVEALRAELVDGGYRPIEVLNHDANHPSAGKAPIRDHWQFGPPIEHTDPAALNTGILCDGLRAFDIDIDDPAIAATVRARLVLLFGETVVRYRTNSPRTLLLYRAAEGTPPKRRLVGTAGKVEVLGRGQQCVAFGKHPTGADLLWQMESPRTVPVDQLPTVTEDEITAFFAEIATDIGAAVAGEAGEHAERRTSPFGQAGELLAVMAAIDAIPNAGAPDWEGWNLRPGRHRNALATLPHQPAHLDRCGEPVCPGSRIRLATQSERSSRRP
jgi:hypothetical protein